MSQNSPALAGLNVMSLARTSAIDWIFPTQFRVIVTRRPKYACRSCEAGVTHAPAPAHIIACDMPSEATLTHVIVSKYADHLPLYRQTQIYSRQGIDLKRLVSLPFRFCLFG
ncbi:transposase [Labrenzia sp. EL_13]|nr:transposase [Labrenzia sp. EL_13]